MAQERRNKNKMYLLEWKTEPVGLYWDFEEEGGRRGWWGGGGVRANFVRGSKERLQGKAIILQNSLNIPSAPIRYVPTINPFAAPACKISGLKDARTRLQTVYFPVL